MNKILLVVGVIGIMLSACISPKKVVTHVISSGDNSQNALDWAGTYEGTVPCADCDGIKTTIVLNKDNTFTMTKEYLGKKGNSLATGTGKFVWNPGGGKISLLEPEGRHQYLVGENQLIHLDMDGNRITGELAANYVLAKKQIDAMGTGIEDKTWKLVTFIGKEANLDEKKYVINFNSKDHQMSTYVGCNWMGATYTITDGTKLKFGPILSTLMACSGANIERAYADKLSEVDNFTTDGETLQLNIAKITVATYKLGK